MVSVEIALEILDEIEKALDLGFDKMYVNVDDLENYLDEIIENVGRDKSAAI